MRHSVHLFFSEISIFVKLFIVNQWTYPLCSPAIVDHNPHSKQLSQTIASTYFCRQINLMEFLEFSFHKNILKVLCRGLRKSCSHNAIRPWIRGFQKKLSEYVTKYANKTTQSPRREWYRPAMKTAPVKWEFTLVKNNSFKKILQEYKNRDLLRGFFQRIVSSLSFFAFMENWRKQDNLCGSIWFVCNI